MNDILFIRIYYNQDKKIVFLEKILFPICESFIERGMIGCYFYRTSTVRGHHFKLYFRLSGNAIEIEPIIIKELSTSILQYPSSIFSYEGPPTSFFEDVPANTISKTTYQSHKLFTDMNDLNNTLEEISVIFTRLMHEQYKANHSPGNLDWILPVSDTIYKGLGVNIKNRIAPLALALEKLSNKNLISSTKNNELKKEMTELLKKTNEHIRRSYFKNKSQYEKHLDSPGAEIKRWCQEIEIKCKEISVLCINHFNQGTFKLPNTFTYDISTSAIDQQCLGYMFSVIWSGLIDQLFVKEEDAMISAYSLRALYTEKIADDSLSSIA